MSGGRQRTGDRFLRLLAWMIVAAVGVVTLTQAFEWTPTQSVAIVQSLTPYLGVALVPVVLYSLWRADRIMTTTALAIGFGLLVLATPVAVPGDQPAGQVDAQGLAVASVNLYYRNDQIDEVAERLLTESPDVIVFSEFTAEHQAALLASDLADDYPHRVERPRLGGAGGAVWSRAPMTLGERPDTVNQSLDLTIDTPDVPIRLLAIHVPTPINSFGGWHDDLSFAAQFGTDAQGAAMVVGDLNASYWHPQFRELLDAGLTDAHTAVGAGFTSSWPTGSTIPPFVRLDHALTTDELVPTAVRDFDIPGSDHRGLVVTVVPAR